MIDICKQFSKHFMALTQWLNILLSVKGIEKKKLVYPRKSKVLPFRKLSTGNFIKDCKVQWEKYGSGLATYESLMSMSAYPCTNLVATAFTSKITGISIELTVEIVCSSERHKPRVSAVCACPCNSQINTHANWWVIILPCKPELNAWMMTWPHTSMIHELDRSKDRLPFSPHFDPNVYRFPYSWKSCVYLTHVHIAQHW